MSTKKKAREFLESKVGVLTFGELLESIRMGDELTLVQFAKKLEVSKSHLCDIEKGRKNVSPERAAAFAKKLGYSKEQFVRLSLQDLVTEAGLKLTVHIKAA